MSYQPSAALLLNPKGYRRQNTAGMASSLSPQPAPEQSLNGGPGRASRRSTEPPSSSVPSLSRSLSTPPFKNVHQEFNAVYGLNSFKLNKAHTPEVRPSAGKSHDAADTRHPSVAGAPTGTTFDPRQLLDPRKAHSPKNTTTNSSILHSLEDSNGADNATRESSVSNDEGPKRELDQFLKDKQANMIESMYGVERRENQLQKRVKVDSGEVQNSNGNMKAKFSTTGNSFLGGYMKEKSNEPNQSTTVAGTIDLTVETDDKNEDDDVIFVSNKDRGSEEVCYGRIEGALVLAHAVPTPAKSVFSGTAPDWPSIRCELLRERSQTTKIEVKDSTGRIFGTIDAFVSAALAPLLDGAAGLRTQARLDVRRKKGNEWPGRPCSDTYRISINLYGPRKFANNIGNFLSSRNLWLGIPNAVEAGIPTVNPHTERRRLAAVNAQQTTKFAVQSETRTVEEISSAVTKMFDQLKGAENLPEVETPELLKTQLLPHQKQALGFMIEKEKPRKLGPQGEDNNSLWRVERQSNGQQVYTEIISGVSLPVEPPQSLGGLLADMMGLGKTLSILSLVCATLPEAAEWAKKMPETPSTLNAKTTLLVSPLSAVGNWVGQIKEHLKENALSYYVFHGPTRTEDPKELGQYDVVITTYTTILSDVSGKSSKRGTSPLTRMNMFRIVLDEAHTIREQSTAQSQAIFQLEAQRRWSVTGTPIQNRLEDLGSITKFLRLHPYNERGRFSAHIVSPFKSENPNAIANLRVLVDSFTLRRVKDRINLPPRHDQNIMLSFSEQEKKLHDFFKKESNFMMNIVTSENREKSGKVYHIVLKAMMILRQISAHGKELLDKEDRERFKGLSANDAIDLDELDDNGTKNTADRKAYEMLALMKESAADLCVKCGNYITLQSADDSPEDKNAMVAAILPCYDILCVDCFVPLKPALDGYAGKPVQVACAFCKGIIAPAYSTITSAGFEQYQASKLEAKRNGKQAKELGQYEGPHTKTKALISQLVNTAEENKRESHQPPIKSVVFSSWTSHLDLIEIAMEDNGLNHYTRLDGSMSLKQRNAALRAFEVDDNITILLATLGAGGVGLNLTSASKVYIMEPQYNPAAVAQAVDRVHRIGQTREVTTVQFIMKESIEEKITELAKRKQKLADMSLNRKMDKRELQQERLKEYRSLFK